MLTLLSYKTYPRSILHRTPPLNTNVITRTHAHTHTHTHTPDPGLLLIDWPLRPGHREIESTGAVITRAFCPPEGSKHRAREGPWEGPQRGAVPPLIPGPCLGSPPRWSGVGSDAGVKASPGLLYQGGGS